MASVYKRKSIRGYRYQALIRHSKRGHDEIRVSASFSTRSAAEAWAEKVEAEIKSGHYHKNDKTETLTFHAACTRYKEQITCHKRGALQERYRFNTILSHFDDKALPAITSADVSLYRDTRIKAGAASTTILHELALISHVFTVAAKDWGFMSLTNPVSNTRKPKPNAGRDRRLKVGELDAVLSTKAGSSIKDIVLLALETAARQGELSQLKWENIDLHKKTLTFDLTKSGTSRIVPLSPGAIEILSHIPRPLGGGRVFKLSAHAIAVAWRRAVTRARTLAQGALVGREPGYLDDLHFHDLRHEATSRFFELGLNPMQVAAITGHKTLEMLKRYTHLKAEDLAAVIASAHHKAQSE